MPGDESKFAGLLLPDLESTRRGRVEDYFYKNTPSARPFMPWELNANK